MAQLSRRESAVTNRREARHELSRLLMRGEFELAAVLSKRWLKYGTIKAEDHSFTEEIIHAASCPSSTLGPEGVAQFDLYLLEPGLWHMHGSGRGYTAPYAHRDEGMAKAEQIARELGAREMIVRVHNRWNSEL